MSSERKKTGATFTPKILSDFVSINVLNESSDILKKDVVRILEPSIGEGELICSILENVEEKNLKKIEVYGFDTNIKSVGVSECRLKNNFPPDFVSKVLIKTSSNACGYSICVAKFFSSHVAQM